MRKVVFHRNKRTNGSIGKVVVSDIVGDLSG